MHFMPRGSFIFAFLFGGCLFLHCCRKMAEEVDKENKEEDEQEESEGLHGLEVVYCPGLLLLWSLFSVDACAVR